MFDEVKEVGEIKEIAAIYNVNDKQETKLDGLLEELENNLLIETASLKHIERWEKMLGLVTLDSDSLTDRRMRVKTKVNESLPYTIRTLKRRLNALCGDEGYTMTIDRSNKKLTIQIALDRKAEIDTAKEIIEEMTPLTFVLDISLIYNTWEQISDMTWEEAEAYTWEEIRELKL